MSAEVGRLYRQEWRMIEMIGQGAQARASLVEHKSTGELAVRKKMAHYDLLEDGMPLEPLILREILPSSRNIVTMINHTFEGDDRQGYDLVQWFEYCRGGDLQHAVDELESVPEDFIWHCFEQIAHALDIIHNCGSHRVVHRDIKPDNIFLASKYRHTGPWPNLKVGDFGTATLEEYSTGVHVARWQGPEIPELSAAGDIWSLGAIIHWMAHGRPPMRPPPHDFTRLTWECLPKARLPQPLPSSYSSKLNNYMLDCLEWNPNDRISSRVLADGLERDRPLTRRRWG